MKLNNVELLSPAGDYDSLFAAVQAGANAIYLSGKEFGARKFAKNFTNDELEKAVDYCHIRNVKTYLTVNTVIDDFEFESIFEQIKFAYEIGIDALIIQDIGLAKFVKENFPGFEMHASTQMSAHSVRDVLYLSEIGFSRVVLARELTTEEINEIKAETTIELETFVHGSLCVSYSGQCYMSSMIGGRSGNRGNCAQSCRQLYTVDGTPGYFLSTKDLKFTNLADLADAVTSVKIEGRMKKPEYVYSVITAYRKILDKDNPEEVDRYLAYAERIFTRGQTTGFIGQDDKKNMMQSEFPGNYGVRVGTVHRWIPAEKVVEVKLTDYIHLNDEIQVRKDNTTVGARVEYIKMGNRRVSEGQPGDTVALVFKYPISKGDIIYRTTDDKLLANLREEYRVERQKINVSMNFIGKYSEYANLTITDDKGNTVMAKSSDRIEKALKTPMSKEKINEQLNKTGGTAYLANNIDITIGDNLSIPISEINRMRREALEELDLIRSRAYKRNSHMTFTKENKVKLAPRSGSIGITVTINTLAQLDAILKCDGISKIIYTDIETLEQACQKGEERKILMAYRSSRIMHTKEYDRVESILSQIVVNHKIEIMVNNYGMLMITKQFELPFSIDWNMNVFNSNAYEHYEELEAKTIALSPELNLDQIKEILLTKKHTTRSEIIGFGRLPIMITNYCLKKSIIECQNCSTEPMDFVDKIGVKFPVYKDQHCRNIIFNASYYLIADGYKTLLNAGIDNIRFEYFDETPEYIETASKLYIQSIKGDKLSYEELRKISDEYYGSSPTRGHLKRGVVAGGYENHEQPKSKGTRV